MSGNAKDKDYSIERRMGTDFGAVFPAARDKELRTRVAKAIYQARTNENAVLDINEIREIATYISELESFLYVLNAGYVSKDDALNTLKNCTGLDIKKQIQDSEAILATEE